jgi:ATP-binding cassette subfamily F protein 3
MEKIELQRTESTVRMSFSETGESAGRVIEAKELGFSYEGTPVFSGLSFLINKGERVVFLGTNGCGKSTLTKLIASRLTGYEGSLDIGYNIEIGYYDQQLAGLSDSATVFSELKNAYPSLDDLKIRDTLALFLFVGDDVFREVSKLSGGERARLALAKLMLKKVNLLLLDEPTNHLDIGSLEALENALLAFGGTIVAVSHDRYFINRIATRIIELDKDTERGLNDFPLEEYDDAYGEYMNMRRLRREAREEAHRECAAAPSSSKEEYERRKAKKQSERNLERKIERAKEKIASLEGELSEIEARLLGDAATDYKLAMELDARRSEIEDELLSLYELVM